MEPVIGILNGLANGTSKMTHRETRKVKIRGCAPQIPGRALRGLHNLEPKRNSFQQRGMLTNLEYKELDEAQAASPILL